MDSYSRHTYQPGWIEIIAGGMYSGKTEELIRQIRRAEIARQKHQLFKPKIDDRYSKTQVASHNKSKQPSLVVENAWDIFRLTEQDTCIVGIDEGQFFKSDLLEVANKLANAGKRVIIAGLDTDWTGKPFGPIPQLMAMAEVVKKQHAICVVCGASACRTQRLVPEESEVLVGASEMYEARCRTHFDPELSVRLKESFGHLAKANVDSMESAQL